jgi:hypothetical protein
VSSSDPQPPVQHGGSKPPSTQEIPVVQPAAGATATSQLPPHPQATAHAPVQPVGSHVPTGPVDFVPGLPGAGTPPPPHGHAVPEPAAAPAAAPSPAPATAPAPAAPSEDAAGPSPAWPDSLLSDGAGGHRRGKLRDRRPRDRAALLGVGLAVLAVVLLELGLVLDFGGKSHWSTIPLWSAFATVCALVTLVAHAASHPAADQRRSGPAWRVAAGGLVGVAVFWLLVVLPDADTNRGFLLTAGLGALGAALWVGPGRKG